MRKSNYMKNSPKGSHPNVKCHNLWKKSIIFFTPPTLPRWIIWAILNLKKKMIFDDPPPQPELGKI